ncbi:MAG: NAD(+)/NADH kinase [Candidatus Obscuribacterales bacterium]|nr:NAD(+)/NADH kinase [Candidatus Obscuribacterales bacterium]
MKLAKVLVVFKKSTLQLQALEYKEPRFLKLLEEGHASVAKVKTAHEQHMDTLEAIEAALKARGIAYDSCHRAELDEKTKHYDLLITVGGDGTFLDASHNLRNVPILGVNSAPGTSFGHFSLANRNNFESVLEQIINDELSPERLLRLELSINGKVLPELVLNEVLISHSNPAGTSRYIIKIGDKEEEQRSSGLWVGPPSGSTGALKSAGAEVLSITDQRFQYVVREAWTRPGQHFMFVKGKIPRSQHMIIISQMRTGALYIDGQHIEYPFPLGDELMLRAADDDLLAFVNPQVNDIFLNES